MARPELHRSDSYVTRLDNCWHGQHALSVAVLHTERVTNGGLGNKAFKFEAVVRQLKAGAVQRVMSFGGAWSNHLHALAFVCHRYGVESVGVVRESECPDNVLLESARRYGMRIHVVSRADYRKRDDPFFCRRLRDQLDCDVWLPEGGSTDSAVDGCKAIGDLILQSSFDPTLVALPVGTGATFAGIARSLPESVALVGLPVVRDDKVAVNVSRWLASLPAKGWQLRAPVTPAYGKVTHELLDFMVRLHKETGVLLDPVYTGKSLLHCVSREFTNRLPANSRLLFIHTGGLMGCYGQVERIAGMSDQSAAQEYLQSLQRLCAVHLG